MIVPAGVLVEFDLAPVVASLLGESIRKEPQRDSERLRRLLADLTSARTSVASEVSTSVGGPWLSTREEAERRGVTDRTIRRRCENGQIAGAWKGEDGAWRIAI